MVDPLHLVLDTTEHPDGKETLLSSSANFDNFLGNPTLKDDASKSVGRVVLRSTRSTADELPADPVGGHFRNISSDN